jgi:uncharacterized protein (DUF2141 family)
MVRGTTHSRFTRRCRWAAVVGGAIISAGCATPGGKGDAKPDVRPDGVAMSTLHVRVEGSQPDRPVQGGLLRAALYREQATFLKGEGISLGKTVDPETAPLEFLWEVPEGTELAVSVFHDLDADGDLDRGAFGIPSEPWGFSGTPSPLGPPRWKACAIRIAPGRNEITIRLFGSPANR